MLSTSKKTSSKKSVSPKKSRLESVKQKINSVSNVAKQESTVWPLENNFLLGGATIFLSSILFFIFLLIFVYNIFILYILIGNRHVMPPIYIIDRPVGEIKHLPQNIPMQQDIWQTQEVASLSEQDAGRPDVNFMASPDGSQFAYTVNRDGGVAVSLNNTVGPVFDEITFMVFSPDSKRFAYGVKTGSNQAVVLDGNLSAEYDWIFPPYFFTPDSQYFVYKIRNSGGDALMFNNTSSAYYDKIYSPFLNTDKTKLMYYSRKGNRIYQNSLLLN